MTLTTPNCPVADSLPKMVKNNILKIDGVSTPVWWSGGTAPSDGGGSGVDMYTFNIVKTGSATYHVVGNQTKTS